MADKNVGAPCGPRPPSVGRRVVGPLLFATACLALVVSPANALGDIAQADSPSFTLDTVQGPTSIGGQAAANSTSFTLDTRAYLGPFFAGPMADSSVFTLDTRGGSGAVVGGGVVAVYPAISYNPATRTLSLSMRATDSLYGTVTSGNFGWFVAVKNGPVVASGAGVYSPTAGQWQAGATLGSDLAGGSYEAIYTITSDRNRQGWAMAPLTVAGPGIVVNGTVKDASTQTPLSGAQVAIFPAGGAGGLWTLVSNQYGGQVPPLATLLGQLTPAKPAITTGTDGAFSWADVPVGNSYVIVAAQNGYQQKWSDSFNVSAAGATVTRNFELSALDQTLAALLKEVRFARARLESILFENARVVGAITEQFYADERVSLDGWTAYNFMGNVGGALSGGCMGLLYPQSVQVPQDEMLRIMAAVNDASRKTLLAAAADCLTAWGVSMSLPQDYLAYLQAEPHTCYSNSIRQSLEWFEGVAPGQPLTTGFSPEKFESYHQQLMEAAMKVIVEQAKYLASPKASQGIHCLTLNQAADMYMEMSEWLQRLKETEKVLSAIQIVGGFVCVSGVATSWTGGGAVAAGAAVVASQAASCGKWAISGAKIGLKYALAGQLQTAVGVAYPQDNASAAAVFADYVSFLRDEAAAPFYLHASNRFDATVSISLPAENIRAIYGFPGFEVADRTAAVTVEDRSTVQTGGSSVEVRCNSYCLWAPVTFRNLIGAVTGGNPELIQTSSDVRGPASVSPGRQAEFEVPYRGYTKNLLSYFAPHVLVVESYVGPWRAGTAYKAFMVLGPFEVIPKALGAGTPISLTGQDVVAPVSTSGGRLGGKDLEFGPEALTPVAVDSLSAGTPEVSGSFTAGTNLWAIDFQLFAPAEAGVSLLVTDSQGRRLGYCSTNGITYNELTGLVTDQGQRPISLRVFNPSAGETYTATVALLTPGAQGVPVSLFAEAKEVSGAMMVSMPGRVILDSALGTNQSVDVMVGEASQQQALTNVSGTLSNLVKWGGTAVLPVLTNLTQSLPDVGAGESGGVSWPVHMGELAERGKYVGNVRLSSAQTADLDVPVVAVVRGATNVVSLFEGTNEVSGVLQTTVTNVGGSGLTWVHLPKGYFVVHGQFGVAGGSTNLLNPTLDIGADGSVEWAFSGVFDMGVVVDNVETPFNNYLVAHPSPSNTVAVPIRLTGNAGGSMQLGGLQLYLETVPNELRAVEVLPDGRARFELLGQPGYSYRVEAADDLVSWQSLGSVLVTNSVMPFADTTAPGHAARFYRAVLE